MKTQFVVGQTVFVSRWQFDRGKAHPHKITKVGRLWISLDYGYRFPLAPREEDPLIWALDGAGHSSPGDVYRSLEDVELVSARERAWRELQQLVQAQRRRPKGLEVGDIKEALRLLKLERQP